MKDLLKSFWTDESGQGLTEYALIIALVAIGLIIVLVAFRNEIGQRIHAEICQVCWSEWLQQQTMLINHYGLNLRDPDALREAMERLLSDPAECERMGARAREDCMTRFSKERWLDDIERVYGEAV